MSRQSNAFQRLALVACTVGALVAPATASAAEDLVVLEGDPAPLLQGVRAYGRVYINSTLRLTGPTALVVSSLYIGPRAQIQTCWVPDPANPLEDGDANGCTNGRSLTIKSSGPVQIAPNISLTGGNGASRAGGALVITGGSITLGGGVDTSGLGGAPSGNVVLSTPGLLRFQSISAPGAGVSLVGARGISTPADVDVRPYNGGPAAAGSAPRAGAIGVNSAGGNVSIRGGLFADGANAGAGLVGGNGGAVTVRGGHVRVTTIQTSGGSTQNVLGGVAGIINVGARGRGTFGSLTANGGGSGGNGRSMNGAAVIASAVGPLVVGTATASGPQGQNAGGSGGTVRLRGSTVTATNLSASGGAGTQAGANAPGGNGGRIDIVAAGRVLVPGLGATGGNGAGAGAAGRGGVVIVNGSRMQISGGVTASGGDGQNGPAGAGGVISLATSAGSLRVLGGLDASGSPSTTSVAAPGGAIAVVAKGPAYIAGQVGVQGANGATGGSSAGKITLRAPLLDLLGGLGGSGGNGNTGNAPGGRGAVIDVATSGDLLLQSLSVAGGNGTGAGAGGAGGTAVVSGAALRVFGGIDVTGGTSPNGNGGGTGKMSVKATGLLTIAGTLDASGTSAPNGVASTGGVVAIGATADAFIAGINVSGGNGLAGGSPAGTVVLRGGNVDVGQVNAGGGNGVGNANGGRGGAIDIVTSGEFTSAGSLSPSGGGGAGTGSGGAGGAVGVSAADIAVAGVDVSGGGPGQGNGGASGRAKLVAFGDLQVPNGIDASGTGGGSGGAATDGGPIYLRAGNGLTTGAINLGGGSSVLRGGHGSRLDLIAHDASIASIVGDGGSGTGGGNAFGGRGGAVVGRLTGRLDVGPILFRGGTGANNATGGAGGVVDITAAEIDASSASTTGGGGGGRGANGGVVKLDATGDLTVLGTIQTDGAQGAGALGAGQPGFPGGSAGRVFLRAADGTVALAQALFAQGGGGGAPGTGFLPGAAGGNGGLVDIVARRVGALHSVETTGGDGSGPQDNAGPGGNGGPVRVWSDDGVLDGSRFVATGGGVGIPGGLEGTQSPDQSPADVTPSKKTIAFTLRSPDAQRIGLKALNGPQSGLVVSSSGVAGPLRAPAPVSCIAVRYAVVGLAPSVGWVSDQGGVVRGTAAKSKKCGKAPRISAVGKKVVVSLAAIAATGYHARIGVRVAGIGTIRADVLLGKASAANATVPALSGGRATVDLVLPPALRKPGTYPVRLIGRSLTGGKTKKAQITLEVRP